MRIRIQTLQQTKPPSEEVSGEPTKTSKSALRAMSIVRRKAFGQGNAAPRARACQQESEGLGATPQVLA